MQISEHQDLLSISGFLETLGRGKKLFLLTALIGVALTGGATYFYPQAYVASTVVLPPQQSNTSAASVLSQLGGGMIAPVKTPDELYVALLSGRQVQAEVISKFNLVKAYGSSTLSHARKTLSGRVVAVTDKKSGLITIEVEDRDPQLAANIANAHVVALRGVLSRMAVTEAQKRRAYFEKMVESSRSAFSLAEQKFISEQAKGGWVVTQADAEYDIQERLRIRSQISSKQIEINAMSRSMTEKSPERQRVAAELAALRQQLGRTQTTDDGKSQGGIRGGVALQAYRDMRFQEAIIESMTKQLELARADESKDGPLLQQLDVAIAPEAPSRPRRLFMLLLGMVLTGLSAVVVGLFSGYRGLTSESWLRVRRAWSNNAQSAG